MKVKYAEEFSLVKNTVLLAAQKLKNYQQENPILSQIARDIKTVADKEVELFILKELQARSKWPILAEESFQDFHDDKDIPRFIVDPLDGTMNFTRHIPFYGISIGFWENAETPIFGLIYDAPHDALYSGYIGHGAWKNDMPIHVSQIDRLEQSILFTGFPSSTDMSNQSILELAQLIRPFKKIRMPGCASLSMALVADGSAEAYHERNTMIWDVAAGVAIITAAGGSIHMEKGTRQYAVNIVAQNGKLSLNHLLKDAAND